MRRSSKTLHVKSAVSVADDTHRYTTQHNTTQHNTSAMSGGLRHKINFFNTSLPVVLSKIHYNSLFPSEHNFNTSVSSLHVSVSINHLQANVNYREVYSVCTYIMGPTVFTYSHNLEHF